MIEVKKIAQALDLGGYDEAYAGTVIWVWVNLPQVLRQKRMGLLRTYAQEIAAQRVPVSRVKVSRARAAVDRFFVALRLKFRRTSLDAAQAEQFALMAKVWSASGDARTHWTVAEIQTIFERDAVLFGWLARESMKMVDAWQADKKK